tara:strand:+ start:212 stop:412 length:201 start_codon:yes stop_codon:yes gene_type:complete
LEKRNFLTLKKVRKTLNAQEGVCVKARKVATRMKPIKRIGSVKKDKDSFFIKVITGFKKIFGKNYK